MDAAYGTAFLDWLACAFAGRRERAARAARAAGDDLLERVAWLGTAGHVLDFDDTYLPGIAHLSAPTAPAALALAARDDRSVGDMLDAHAAGFEAMGALSRASHPALYERGFHPTAVCGAPGAAVTASRLLGLDPEPAAEAERLALLQTGGLRAGFGSDGKSLAVGMAAAAGVLAARVAAGGGRITPDVVGGPGGFATGLGGGSPVPGEKPAVAENWIKPWPCCLLAHSSLEAAARARAAGDGRRADSAIEVTVHPVARRAAPYDDVADGLQAKFSIPYLVAYTLLHGEPEPRSFDAVDEAARAVAARVRVRTDKALLESEARLAVDGEEVRVEASRGSPGRPLREDELEAKLRALGADGLRDLLEDPARPAREVMAALAAQ